MGTSPFPVWPRGIAHPQLQRFFESLRQRVLILEETVEASSGGGWTSLTDQIIPKYDSAGDELVDSIMKEVSGAIVISTDPTGTETLRVGGGFAMVGNLVIYSAGLGDYGILSFHDVNNRFQFSRDISVTGNANLTGGILSTDAAIQVFRCGVGEQWDCRGAGDVVRMRFQADVVDSGAAIAFYYDTINALSTTGARLLRIQNNAVDKFSIYHDGGFLAGTDPGGTAFARIGGGVRIGDAAPFLDIYETDAIADKKWWSFRASAGDFYGSSLTDGGSSSDFLRMSRQSGDAGKVSRVWWFPTNYTGLDAEFLAGTNTGYDNALMTVSGCGDTGGLAVYNQNMVFGNAGGATPANEIQFKVGVTPVLHGRIVAQYNSNRMEYWTREDMNIILDESNTQTDAHFVIRMHNTSGDWLFAWQEGSGVGWTDGSGSITTAIADSSDIVTFPIANAAWLTWRNQADSADISVLQVDANDDTVLAADASDQILFKIATTTYVTLGATGTLTVEGTLDMNTADIYLDTGYAVRESSTTNCAFLPRPAADYTLLRGQGNVIVQVDSDATSGANVFQVRHDATTHTGGTLLFAVSEAGWTQLDAGVKLYQGTGVPSGLTGETDGDIYFRTDGGSGTMIYALISSTWTAIA
jgi:hypothetical protein